jgi:hypothetical protein
LVPQSVRYLLSYKNISIIAMLYFDIIVRQVMALSLERGTFFFTKRLLDERWEVVTYLVYYTVVRLCQFFWLWREIVLKMRTRFYKKILLGY